MDAWRFILTSLRHYRRIHIAVMLGVAVATAVLTGALLVGDSVRGSLRDLTLERLGRIDTVVVAGQPFRAALAAELSANSDFRRRFASAEPALLLTGTLQFGSGKDARRATQISLIGIGRDFWSLGQGGPEKTLREDEIAITEPVARELGLRAGETLTVRIPLVGAIPADSTLGEKSETSKSRSLKVSTVLRPEGIARFGIVPSQQLPRNAFMPLATLQALLGQPEKANAILIATNETAGASSAEAQRALEKSLQPTLEDYGLRWELLRSPVACAQISANQLVLPNEVVRATEAAFPNGAAQPIVTYLANTIRAGEGAGKQTIPYSTITGVDSTAMLGPLLDTNGQPIQLADDEIGLNRWAADELGVKVGDTISVTYYDPESTHGKLHEHEPVSFKLRAIVDLTTPDGKPTRAADPQLTPALPGVTDQKSISDWDLPFALTEKIRPQDEEYWNEHRTTPKAFVSLATAKKLWGSRWGSISLVRIPLNGEGDSEHKAREIARVITPSSLGMAFLPVKRQGLAASAGTTPFEALFLGFSFFLIAAAVMLVALLFQLGIEQRASELGTLAAIGIRRKRMTRLLAREGFIVAAAGATLGIAGGVAYAWLMIYGLRTWWLAAISTPFLRLHVWWPSLLIGWVTGVIVSWLTIRWSIRKLVRQPVNRLLGGAAASSLASSLPLTTAPNPRGARRVPAWGAVRPVLAMLVVMQLVIGFFLRGEAQAGIFFGSGAATLVLLLGEIRHRLRHMRREMSFQREFSLARLSTLNTTRNPGRSTLTIGLVAAASFLIIAVSAFRLNTGEGGTGGFEFVATSDLPIHFDLNTASGRQELGIGGEAERVFTSSRIYALRVVDGENASCLNLYRPKQPRVLGVPQALIERGGFAWSGVAKAFKDNPWRALNAQLKPGADGREIVPIVLDMSTAIYSLHLGGIGARLTVRDAADRPVDLEVVGLLENSVLQGNVLMSEANSLKLFPDVAGYRYFLIDQVSSTPESGQATFASGRLLEAALADDGFDVVEARERLAQYLAVQNTYLSTFQSLGALGLLLGTVGLAVVQLRSVLERRRELALMRAGGFRAGRLVRMVLFENAVLLLGGLAVGSAAAAVALIPHWMPHSASIPLGTLILLIGMIAIVGLVAGWIATRSTLRAPIVAALRGD